MPLTALEVNVLLTQYLEYIVLQSCVWKQESDNSWLSFFLIVTPSFGVNLKLIVANSFENICPGLFCYILISRRIFAGCTFPCPDSSVVWSREDGLLDHIFWCCASPGCSSCTLAVTKGNCKTCVVIKKYIYWIKIAV